MDKPQSSAGLTAISEGIGSSMEGGARRNTTAGTRNAFRGRATRHRRRVLAISDQDSRTLGSGLHEAARIVKPGGASASPTSAASAPLRTARMLRILAQVCRLVAFMSSLTCCGSCPMSADPTAGFRALQVDEAALERHDAEPRSAGRCQRVWRDSARICRRAVSMADDDALQRCALSHRRCETCEP